MLGYRLVKEKQIEDMEDLISMLESFVFVAETDANPSMAVRYAREKLNKYDIFWR